MWALNKDLQHLMIRLVLNIHGKTIIATENELETSEQSCSNSNAKYAYYSKCQLILHIS